MKILLVCALFAVSVISLTSASCMSGSLHNVTYQWLDDKVTPYCDYFGSKIAVGSNFTNLDDCYKCQCTESGLSCCGIGYYAGVASIAGCYSLPDGCERVFFNSTTHGACQP